MPVINSRICIDARFWGIAHTGIGRYTENLISNLPKEAIYRITLICSSQNYQDAKLKSFTRVLAKYHPYSFLSQIEMPFLLWKINPDVFHATHSSIPVFWPGKIIVTFHDLIRHYSKGPDTTTRTYLFYWFKYWSYLLVDRIALWRATKIIVPSQYWHNQIVKKFKIPGSKIIVTYEGVGDTIHKVSKDFAAPISKPYVVYTGNLYPHKNLPVLFQAIKTLSGKVNLVLVGARSVFVDRAKNSVNKFGISDWVTILGRLSDDQLSQLYSHALAFVFPSRIEGFGLTGLEAMAAGLPVIAADSSCLPEIYGDSALYFNPDNPEQLVNNIELILSDPGLRNSLTRKGYKKVKSYSWVKMAALTWNIYQNA